MRQKRDIALQGQAEPAENAERDVPLTSLDPADVAAVDFRFEGEPLLRPAELLSARPDSPAEFLEITIDHLDKQPSWCL
jgi:hypothetical protein